MRTVQAGRPQPVNELWSASPPPRLRCPQRRLRSRLARLPAGTDSDGSDPRGRGGAVNAASSRTRTRASHRVAPRHRLRPALWHFFDTLVTRHAAPLNPFQSVRDRKHDTSDGKTPGSSIQQARDLLRSIDTSHVVDLCDRALLGTLAHTGARVGAVARLQRGDL